MDAPKVTTDKNSSQNNFQDQILIILFAFGSGKELDKKSFNFQNNVQNKRTIAQELENDYFTVSEKELFIFVEFDKNNKIVRAIALMDDNILQLLNENLYYKVGVFRFKTK